MNITIIIQLVVLLIALGSFIVTLYKITKANSKEREDNSIKIQSTHLAIVRLEKDIIELKDHHKRDYLKLETDFVNHLQQLRKENREEHGKMFDKMETAVVSMAKVATSLEYHLKESE